MIPFESAPAIRLRSAYLLTHRAVNRRLRPFGVTADQYVVLRFLAEEDGISQQELVELCASDPTTMGRMLDLLEEKGCLSRRDHPTDGRTRQVLLTGKGRELCDRLYRATAAIRAAFEKALSPREMEAMLLSLRKVSEAFAHELATDGKRGVPRMVTGTKPGEAS